MKAKSGNPTIRKPGAAHRRTLERRKFIGKTAAGAVTLAGLSAARAQEVLQPGIPKTWQRPGKGFSNYGMPNDYQSRVIRWISESSSIPGDGVSWTPLHHLEGTITPNGLHFERHHNGIPGVDADTWELKLHGRVNKPLAFDLKTLLRYPLTSKVAFIECGGNSNSLWLPSPQQAPVGYVHGLLSCSEWTGVKLSVLLEEAGLADNASWLVVDGLDAAGVSVSLPLAQLPEDTLIALYQNGEALRSENGYPARLLVPGWEGIVNVKWLRSIQVADQPLMSRFDTVSYTDLHKDGIAERFSFEMKVKSLITTPSPGKPLDGPGYYEISGLAWTGNGAIERVEVSVDNGASWQVATLQQPVLDKALTRFRLPWHWDGKTAVLKSRAYDKHGQVQPTRDALLTEKGTSVYYHYNAIVAWAIDADGYISHVYA